MPQDLDVPGRVKPAQKFFLWMLPATVIAATLAICCWLSNYDKKMSTQRFDSEAQHIMDGIAARIHAADNILHAGVGLFNASDSVERREWDSFVYMLDPTEFNPGIQSVGFIAGVKRSEKASYLKRARAGCPGYTIRPSGERDMYFPVLYLAPRRERGRRLEGYDVGTEPALRTALERAVVSDTPKASDIIFLTASDMGASREPGLFLVRAVFKGPVPASQEDRRKALYGFVYVSLRTRVMASSSLYPFGSDVRMRLYDVTPGSQKTLLYDSLAASGGGVEPGYTPDFTSVVERSRYGRTWRAEFMSKPSFASRTRWGRALLLLAGLLLSLLLLRLVRTQIERDRALAEAESAGRRLRLTQFAVDQSGDAVFFVRTDASFLYANAASSKMLGYPHEELMTLRATDINPMYGQESWQDNWDKLRHEQRLVYEAGLKARDGSVVPVEINANHLEYGGAEYKCVFIRDLTARKKLESELKKALAAAESSDRLKSAFLATMSHELRTPLNSIIGFSGILLQGLAGPLNDEQKKQLGMVSGSAEHLLALINDVLDISKIEAGQLQVLNEQFDLREAVHRAVLTAKPMTEKKHLELEEDTSPEVGTVYADYRRVEQVLLNLLSNAIKFTEKGRVRVETRSSGDQAVIRVIDNGIGIKPEDQQTLFKPFRQIDTGLSRQYEGTGLGLSICKKLMELMGGTISVESEWGKGSVFTVVLPVKKGNV